MYDKMYIIMDLSLYLYILSLSISICVTLKYFHMVLKIVIQYGLPTMAMVSTALIMPYVSGFLTYRKGRYSWFWGLFTPWKPPLVLKCTTQIGCYCPSEITCFSKRSSF